MVDEPKTKRRAKRSFTDEFRAGVVDLVLKEGKTPAQVARDLDLTSSTVRTWVDRARADRGDGKPGALTTEEREELSRLRKEFHFGTDAAERMTVVSGEIWAKLPGRADFQLYPAGTSFEIPSKNAFDVRTREPAAYLCEFL